MLSELARMRVWSITFSLFVSLGGAAAFWRIWKSLRRDFPGLPSLTYRTSVAGVVLWGLLFVIVLTMISGARELMTPGAWRKQGFTYRLADEPPEHVEDGQVPFFAERSAQLHRLHGALSQFALAHEGRFPGREALREIPDSFWTVPETFGMKYGYVAGRTSSDETAVLAHEPEAFGAVRLVLLCNGRILPSNSTEIARSLPAER